MRISLLYLYALVFVAILYLPALLLPIFAFNDSTTPTLPLSGFTPRWFADLLRTTAIHEAAWNSLRQGLATAVASARAISRYRFRGQRVAASLIMAPLVLPEIILGVSLLLVLMAAGMSLSLVTVTLGHVLLCLPYSTIVLIAGVEGFDRSLGEASADLGETAWGTFRRVILPLVAPA